ncbi:MAG: hypothetical protein PSV22_13755 [Pseudolabrys sp.]|nr:hypothetical protein [Pseudolabrys sp.]
MADYYPLIARAVAGLDKNTGENRRALYERARAALVNQLRGVDPPLDESDITRERLALEEAIRKLEVEAARRGRPEAAEPDESRPSLRDQGLRDFRDTVAEAQGLGEASAEASRSARAAYDDMQGGAAPSTEEADHDRAGEQRHEAWQENEQGHEQGHEQEHGHAGDQDRDHDEDRDAGAADAHYFEPPAGDQPGIPPDMVPEPPGAPHAEAAHGHEPHFAGDHDVAHAPPPAARRGHAAPQDDDDVYTRPVRSYGRIVKIAVLLMLIGAVAAVGYWQRNAVMKTVTATVTATMTALRGSPATTASKPATPAEPAGRPKISDRVGADSAPSAATAPAAAVAQKVVLYDEDPNDPKGKRYVGSAVWRTETVSPGPGLAPELAIRADVDIPERRMRMTWSLRRNTDKALPASHTIEIMFTLPADFSEGGVGNVPGVLMKQNEEARGVPLAGLAVKVTNGYFLIGLSAVDIDKQRNVQLLKERDWFDIPIVYANGKRAILAVEKGTPGGRAFEEAFRAWGE